MKKSWLWKNLSSWFMLKRKHICILRVNSVCIRNYSGPHIPALGLNTERYSVSLRILSESEKMRTRITTNTDTFYAVLIGWEEFSINHLAFYILIIVLQVGKHFQYIYIYIFFFSKVHYRKIKYSLHQPHLIFICSKSPTETLEKGVKYIQSFYC